MAESPGFLDGPCLLGQEIAGIGAERRDGERLAGERDAQAGCDALPCLVHDGLRPGDCAVAAAAGHRRHPKKTPYVLDGLHHHAHQTGRRIAEHHTDTTDATDPVFGLYHRPGYRFAPRIEGLKDRKLYTTDKPGTYPLPGPMIDNAIDATAIVAQWPEPSHLKQTIGADATIPW